MKLNIPKARQNFLETVPEPGDTVNNFIVRLKVLVKHCNYGDESDNQVRDRVLSHIKDQNLKSKMYRDENLNLAKMTKIIGEYHDKGAMVLVSGKSESKTKVDIKYMKSMKAQNQNRDVIKVPMQGTMSQIFYFGLSFYLMKSRKSIFKK